MVSSNLQRLRILLLRQATDNQDLIQQIEQLKGATMQWTALEIVNNKAQNPATTQNLINQADSCIFISKNAAKLSRPWLETIRQKQVFAIGEGTKQSLKQLGIVDVICPSQASSEALLELPQLQTVENNKIVVLKGVHGREKLQTLLAQRGAMVENVELYQRQSTKMTSDQAKQIIQFSPNWIQLTSEASAVSLDKANQRFKLFNHKQIKVLTASSRLKTILKQMGYVNVFNANSIYNEDNLKALQNAQETS